MKIVINYDFFNAIRDVNEDFSIYKIIRNNKTKWIKCDIPVMSTLYYIGWRDNFFKYFPIGICTYYILEFGMELVQYKVLGDIYKSEAENKLKQIVPMFQKLNIDTSYELIKKATCYSTIYNLQLNKNKIPRVIESKYILLPFYNSMQDIKDISIHQEHIIGSKTYMLSCGSKQKEYKLVYNV